MAEQKQKSTLMQLVLFILMSLVAFAAQMLIGTFGDKLLALCGVDNETKSIQLGIESYTMAGVIAYAIANIVAKVVSYILNRKKTFGAVNNLVFSMTVYVIMCVVLIVVETIIAGPLADLFYKGLKDKGVAYELCKTLSMITYSMVDFAIVFLMEKFVIMNDNLFKNSKKETVEGNAEEAAPVEDTVNDEPVVSAPVVDEKVEEAPVAEEVKEEAPVEQKKTEEVVEETKAEVPVVEEAKEEAAPAEEEKAEEAPAAEEEKAEAKVVEEAKEEAAPAKKTAAKAAKTFGSVEFDLHVDGYHFCIYANNGQLMFESQGFANSDSAVSGFDTFKKTVLDPKVFATVYEDKKGTWRFIIAKRYVGECYKTRKQAEDAIESVKRYTAEGKIVSYEADPEKEAAYADAKKNFNKGTGVDWEKALAIPAKTSGKFTITGHEGRGFFFALYANNGQLLYGSRYFATEDTCESAIDTFKKAAYLNNFFIDKDKFGNFRFVLKGANAGNVYLGETYKTKDLAQSSAESVRKFAASAKIVPYDPNAED